MPTLTELTGKPYLSYSAMSTYLKCGEQFRLTRLERVPEAPAYWFPGGTAVHAGTEVYDLCYEVDGLTHSLALEAAIRAFHQKFTEELASYTDQAEGMEWRAGGRRTKQWPNGEDATWWRANGPEQVAGYANWRQGHSALVLWRPDGETPAVELPFSVEFANGVSSHGYVDRVFLDSLTSELLVADLKSGQRTPADITQLALYATAIERQYGVRPRLGAYFMTRTSELTGLMDLTRFDERMISSWLRMAQDGIEAQRFIPRLSSDCSYCSVAEFCYAKNPDIPVPDFNMTLEEVGA